MIITIFQVEKGMKPFRVFKSLLDDLEFIALAKMGIAKQIKGVDLFKIQKKFKIIKALT